MYISQLDELDPPSPPLSPRLCGLHHHLHLATPFQGSSSVVRAELDPPPPLSLGLHRLHLRLDVPGNEAEEAAS